MMDSTTSLNKAKESFIEAIWMAAEMVTETQGHKAVSLHLLASYEDRIRRARSLSEAIRLKQEYLAKIVQG